jgi:hypothetical protein
MMMNKKLFLMLVGSLVFSGSQATVVEYFEDTYGQQASPELINKAEDAAKLVGFDGLYQVIAAKKAGIDVSPTFYKYIATTVNQQMQYPVMIVNSTWFDTLPQDQQMFLLARAFVIFKEGMLPASVKYLPFLFMLLSILLIFALVWLLGKTRLAVYKRWVRIVAAWVIVTLFNLSIGAYLQTKVLQYFAKKHDMHIIRIAAGKTGNKEAAKAALLAYNAVAQEEVKNGQKAFEPYGNLFEQYANQL